MRRRHAGTGAIVPGMLAAALGWAGLCPSACGAPESATPTRPNILYIFTDDQSRRSIGAYPEAHPWVKTPNIDRLAENGLRFTHCYTGAWCQPSRTCMLTEELYDLDKDPNELDNLSVRKTHHTRLLQLRKEAEREFLKNDGDFIGRRGRWQNHWKMGEVAESFAAESLEDGGGGRIICSRIIGHERIGCRLNVILR